MSDSRPPTYLPLTGVISAVNPTAPPAAGVDMLNFRVMPSKDGGPPWLRLIGGRKVQAEYMAGLWLRIQEFRDPLLAGFVNHMFQNSAGGVVTWQWISLANFLTAPKLTIDQSYGGTFTQTSPAPVCNLRDGMILYNGLGVRAGDSRPPFSVYYASIGGGGDGLMYLGLDCYVPAFGGNPTVASSGAGATTILNGVSYSVGLYNDYTGHFSNAVFAGTIAPGANRTITFNTLNAIKPHWHDVVELGHLFFVFYATADLENAQVPYLMMDPLTNYTEPVKCNVANGGVPFAISTAYQIHVDKEAPTENCPPRPMRWIALVNGRVYGALLPGGVSPALPDFSYVSPTRYLCGIVWSAAASDVTDTFFLGAPEHSFPLDNFKSTPNTEMPLHGDLGPDGESLHVVTPSSNFIVYEETDELHRFVEIQGGHGIINSATYAGRTPHGSIWLTQSNSLVALSTTGIVVISLGYPDLLHGKTSRFGTYVRDPENMIDQYHLYFTDGTVLIHDFTTNYAYPATGDFTCGRSVLSNNNQRFHLLAKQHIYTQAGQPDTGLERVNDQTSLGGAAVVIQGRYETHWLDFTDPSSAAEVSDLQIAGDVRAGRLTAYLFSDHSDPTQVGNRIPVEITAALYTAGNWMWAVGKFLITTFWNIKILLFLNSEPTETNYPQAKDFGRAGLARTMLGVIGKLGVTVTKGKIRLQ